MKLVRWELTLNMKTKNIPLRTCIVTKEKLDKRDLLRIVLNKEGELFIDESGKQNGRGAYIKKDLEVLDKLKKNNLLEKHFKVKVDDKIYEEIEEIIKN